MQYVATDFLKMGLECVTGEFDRERPWQRRMTSEAVCALAEEMVVKTFAPASRRCKAYKEFVKGAFEEVSDGAYIFQTFCVNVAQKPMNWMGQRAGLEH